MWGARCSLYGCLAIIQGFPLSLPNSALSNVMLLQRVANALANSNIWMHSGTYFRCGSWRSKANWLRNFFIISDSCPQYKFINSKREKIKINIKFVFYGIIIIYSICVIKMPQCIFLSVSCIIPKQILHLKCFSIKYAAGEREKWERSCIDYF